MDKQPQELHYISVNQEDFLRLKFLQFEPQGQYDFVT